MMTTGNYSHVFHQGAHCGQSFLAEAAANTRGLGGGSLDSEYRDPVAAALSVLSELQTCPSSVATVVSLRGPEGDPYPVDQYAAQGRCV